MTASVWTSTLLKGHCPIPPKNPIARKTTCPAYSYTHISTSENRDGERRSPDNKFLQKTEKYVERTCMKGKSPERSGVTQNFHHDFSVLFKRVGSGENTFSDWWWLGLLRRRQISKSTMFMHTLVLCHAYEPQPNC